ncbi:hypothetical protein [Paracoccus xiamenensis]|uniref:hypothetical protein n=1 Tax=Paracoccus xiamenensis TaxID=2714901 RepID=UPI00140ADBCB|nr:hypothetical protein [Paracoccus xiamenensis]NHF74099.1 hypothetical protein [Paracoccus xiamenensis]
MADKARISAGIAPRVLASWRRPGQVVRELSPMSEGAMLAVLMGAMLVFLIAQAPGHARAAALDPAVPMAGRMAGALTAVLLMMPLVAYAVASLVAFASRLTPWRLEGEDSRLALFWALLAISPAMLLSGLVEGLIGPGAPLSLTRLVAGLGFLFIWGAGLRALSRPA